jgi:hypothetical protein
VVNLFSLRRRRPATFFGSGVNAITLFIWRVLSTLPGMKRHAQPLMSIAVRLIVAVMLAVLVQACASPNGNPNDTPNSPQGQENERMNRMLNPSPNQ